MVLNKNHRELTKPTTEKMPDYNREELLEDELLIVRHSGEIPEVAMHSSIYYLTEDPEGPCIELREKEWTELRTMVIERYREIIHRDLDPDNRRKTIYRGVARCIANWHRLDKFCRKEGVDREPFRQETRAALLSFLQNEAQEVRQNRRSSVNCTMDELACFLEVMQLDCEKLPADWRILCKVAKK